MSKKKAVIMLLITLVLGIAIGVGGTLLVSHVKSENALNGSIYDIYGDGLSGKCGDNLTWTLDLDKSVLTISGTGDMYDFRAGNEYVQYFQQDNVAPWMVLIMTQELYNNLTIVIEDGVTSIGANAFYLDCPGITNGYILRSSSNAELKSSSNAEKNYSLTITDISIADSVTTIGSGAFGKCNFNGADINIPNGVTYIGSSAYTGASTSGVVHIPASVTSFNANAFDGITIKSFDVDSANKTYSSDKGILLNKAQTVLVKCPNGYADSYTVPDSVQTIESYAFYNCTELTGIYFDMLWGCDLTTIGDYAFANCSKVAAVNIPRSVTTIGSHCFENCGMKTLYLMKTIESIGDSAFNGCNNLTEVTFIGNEDDYDALGLDFGDASVTFRDGWA